MTPTPPDFYRSEAILQHVQHPLAFYDPRAVDPSGASSTLEDDGTVYDARTPHLVGSARHVFVWAMAVRHFSDTPAYAKNMHHALAFLRDVHRNAETGGYAWQRD